MESCRQFCFFFLCVHLDFSFISINGWLVRWLLSEVPLVFSVADFFIFSISDHLSQLLPDSVRQFLFLLSFGNKNKFNCYLCYRPFVVVISFFMQFLIDSACTKFSNSQCAIELCYKTSAQKLVRFCFLYPGIVARKIRKGVVWLPPMEEVTVVVVVGLVTQIKTQKHGWFIWACHYLMPVIAQY